MSFPEDFVNATKSLLGEAEYLRLEQALSEVSPTSIRLNRSKVISPSEGAQSVPWCANGFYLPERPQFTFDPLFHAGTYYVQEASSMFVEQAFKLCADEPLRCLDLCAAPGGKSTHLIDLLPSGSVLVSNETIQSRSRVLMENIAKWGSSEVIVTNSGAEAFGRMKNFFDVILTDMPCSGEGMFRKNVASHDEWSLENVQLCAARQRRILYDVWDSLKPGGILIYSTCTYNLDEDEENIHFITEKLGAKALTVPTKADWQITRPLKYDNPVYRFFPHLTRGEGFFLAVLRKEGEADETGRKQDKAFRNNQKLPAQLGTMTRSLVNEVDKFVPILHGDTLSLLSEPTVSLFQMIKEKVHVCAAGITAGTVKGKDFIPSEELALSSSLRKDTFPQVELSLEEAIRYLQKESISLPDNAPRGHVLVTYKNFPLGFVKNLGSRANNLYPSDWRIRRSGPSLK